MDVHEIFTSLNTMASQVDNIPIHAITSDALVVYPRALDRSKLAAVLSMSLSQQTLAIITDTPQQLNIPAPVTVLTFSDIDDINVVLANSDYHFIIFDDAAMLSIILPVLHIHTHAKVIVLTTWGDSLNQLDTVTRAFPDLALLSLPVQTDRKDIVWQTSKVVMSASQVAAYDSASPNIQRMLGLYRYPDHIMRELVASTSICETHQAAYPDTLPGWLTLNDFKETARLRDTGPKLESVIDGIVSAWPHKHVVFTQFNHRGGVDLITAFLELYVHAHKNPYELLEIFSVACTDDYATIMSRLAAFNEADSGVLVTNIVPFIPLTNVRILHVVDSYNFRSVKSILRKCLNYQVTPFTVQCHVATHPRTESVDESLYHKFVNDVGVANTLYTTLVADAARIRLL